MTRRLALALRHVGFEDLGSFEIPLKEAGYAIEYIDIAERDPATLDPLDADLFFILGGPISVYDHADYPFIAAEIELLRVRLGADLPTLGICLGAQMMAAALGARVYPAPEREIGWSALDLSETGGRNFLDALRDVPVLHWHGDTFDLPAGTNRLASTTICQNQAFSRGPNVLALQFHPEVDGERFERWLVGHASELATIGINPSVLRSDASRHSSKLRKAGTDLLAGWLSQLRL
ncbi:glutamine amidotransferase [Aquamicrobium zhengzhouense]|uniref:Glutamine amidotransferase n=1 Tax=Aquamicrobium zhengzhouense TaxID=2781738 RepID=A0ABS0SC12_9HYPH|nr:glutamine amidotransferase [Aquamicrobium zhengzhouense]MBI1620835.1 glutamine amidotransferase [Aquamicrobium zhengzhouense]